ncbi:beta-lactamase superfamily domain-containing protein [Lipomyces japonicus]|uniref:beta-lactamase superfamily domain-containing protein n=1 Tax=Lipomyces japonicus TaxID=56871 RepID=UPI0034CD51A6
MLTPSLNTWSISSRLLQRLTVLPRSSFRYSSSASSSSIMASLKALLGFDQSQYTPCRVSTGLESPLIVTDAAAPLSSPASAMSKSHIDKTTGLFFNPWPSAGNGDVKFSEVLWSKLSREWQSVETSPDMMPVITPDFSAPLTDATNIRSTWLGHASFFVEMPSGLKVLFDPVMGQKCAPTWAPGFNRISRAPCRVADFPGVDVVIISHAHYDHLDDFTINHIRESFPEAYFFVPLGVKKWFTKKGISAVTELDWWEQRDISVNGIDATLGCLPAQHGANRSSSDHGKTLWASWSVTSKGKVYFAGDTGYRHVPRLPADKDDYAIDMPHCPVFKHIGEHRGPFDLALLPIGAYSPRWIMSKVHANPVDSVNIFLDIKARRAIAMHYGTWVLTDEPILEPVQKLKEALKQKALPTSGVFDAVQIGTSVEVPVHH